MSRTFKTAPYRVHVARALANHASIVHWRHEPLGLHEISHTKSVRAAFFKRDAAGVAAWKREQEVMALETGRSVTIEEVELHVTFYGLTLDPRLPQSMPSLKRFDPVTNRASESFESWTLGGKACPALLKPASLRENQEKRIYLRAFWVETETVNYVCCPEHTRGDGDIVGDGEHRTISTHCWVDFNSSKAFGRYRGEGRLASRERRQDDARAIAEGLAEFQEERHSFLED